VTPGGRRKHALRRTSPNRTTREVEYISPAGNRGQAFGGREDCKFFCRCHGEMYSRALALEVVQGGDYGESHRARKCAQAFRGAQMSRWCSSSRSSNLSRLMYAVFGTTTKRRSTVPVLYVSARLSQAP